MEKIIDRMEEIIDRIETTVNMVREENLKDERRQCLNLNTLKEVIDNSSKEDYSIIKEIDIILPFYEAIYRVGEKISITSGSGALFKFNKQCENETVKNIIKNNNNYEIRTSEGNSIIINENQNGIQIIKGEVK